MTPRGRAFRRVQLFFLFLCFPRWSSASGLIWPSNALKQDVPTKVLLASGGGGVCGGEGWREGRKRRRSVATHTHVAKTRQDDHCSNNFNVSIADRAGHSRRILLSHKKAKVESTATPSNKQHQRPERGHEGTTMRRLCFRPVFFFPVAIGACTTGTVFLARTNPPTTKYQRKFRRQARSTNK